MAVKSNYSKYRMVRLKNELCYRLDAKKIVKTESYNTVIERLLTMNELKFNSQEKKNKK